MKLLPAKVAHRLESVASMSRWLAGEQAPELVSVHLLDALHAERELAATARILEGRRFELRDFAPLESTGRTTLGLAFSAPVEGQPLRLYLRPTLEP